MNAENNDSCTNAFCMSLPVEVRKALCSHAHKVQYKKRNEQVLFFDSRYVYIIEAGFALVSRSYMSDYQQGTDLIEPGNIVGVVQLFQEDYDATINLLPLTPVEGCMVSRNLLETLIKEHPECACEVLAELSQRFGRVVSKLAIHSYGSAEERLQFSLNRVQELALENSVTHEDLACLSGLSRVTVTRLLNKNHS